jgi:site-specific DNA-methyltransferase (adenine-specific)
VPEDRTRALAVDPTPGHVDSVDTAASDPSGELAQLELVIERGLRHFIDVGEALLRIRDGALYRLQGYRSFSQYLDERWHLTRRRAYQLIDTAEVVAATPELRNVFHNSEASIPSERLVRELAAAPAPVRLEVVRLATTGAHPRELRALVRQASSQLAEAAAAAIAEQPAAERPPRRRLDRDDMCIEVVDPSRTSVADGAFDLVVGSPPFALDVPYADGGDVPDYSPTYRRYMTAWSSELYRVSNPDHGRVCIEIPVDRSKGGVYEPVYAHWQHALEAAGFRYRTTILRRYHAGRGTARGSIDSPSGTHTFVPLLAIIVVYRGTWLRRSDRAHDLEHDDWLALAGPNGYWDDVPGDEDPEHPAPFHIEVPRRLIKLYSYRDDLIGDPWLGRGTTALACVELGRRFRGGDRSPTYVAIAEERVAAALDRQLVAAAD